jgi:hypothetical protein
LLAQGDVLEGELPVAAAKKGEESQQVEQEVIVKVGFSPDQR